MVRQAGSPTRTVYVDVTLTRSKVKVKVTGLLNFRQFSEAVHAGGDDRSSLVGFSGQPMSIMAKRMDGSRCHLVRRLTSAQATLCYGVPAPPKRGTAPEFTTHVYCGQTAGWMKVPLGVEVDLGPGHIVLDGDTAPPSKRGTAPPIFSALSIVATVANLSYC